MIQHVVHVGVDVSKDELQIDPFDNQVAVVPNTSKGIETLIKRIRAFGGNVRLCCEATGGYEALLITHMLKEKIPLARINPKQARDYAKSCGILAKTDKIDAEVLTAFSEHRNPRLLKEQPGWYEDLRAYVVRRTELIEYQKQEKNHLESTHHSEMKKLIRAHLRQLVRQQEKLEGLIDELIRNEEELEEKVERFTSPKGFGRVVALSALAVMPELGELSDKEATALAGLAPYNSDSGRMRGRRMIRGGRGAMRRGLYMSSVCASQHNEHLSVLYKRLVKAGKPKKVALVAVMRKQICLLNRLAGDPEFVLG